MNRQLEIAKRIHDAAMDLGATCHQGCWFGDAQDQPMAYDSAKSHTVTRAKALSLLTALTN